MPPTRDDRRLLIFTGVFVAVAAVLFAALIYLATNQQDTPDAKRPFFIGLERSKKKTIREDNSPQYVPDPTGDQGFWLDIEDGKLVALVLHVPGRPNCIVKWRDPRGGYVDCDDNVLQSEQLDRYKLIIGSRNGSPKGSVYVDLRKVTPAPDPSAP